MLKILLLLLSFSVLSKVSITYDFKKPIWGITKIDSNTIAFTTKKGSVHTLDLKAKKTKNLGISFPSVNTKGQGGLLDIYFYKDQLFFTYAFKSKKGNTTRLAKVDYKNQKATNFKVLYTAKAFEKTVHHYGSRILIKDGFIFMSVGDRGQRNKAQSLKTDHGSILRLNLDGSIPKTNPYYSKKAYSSAIWSKGHRNSQGIATANNQIYNGEFGPQGGDEINLIKAGANYGWPIITYGEEYGGGKIGKTKESSLIQPLKYWVPSISFSEILIYKNRLYLACLGTEQILRYDMNANKFNNKIKLSTNLKERFRTLEEVDGKIYFATTTGKIGFILE